MAEFNVRSDSVDVEQIMAQIRARIREKRGVDYTEEQVRELATVRLEKFLDPRNLRSDLLEEFRRSQPVSSRPEPPAIEPPYTFDDEDIYATHRGALRFVRRLLNPLLKLLFNPNPLIHVLHKQAEFNFDLLKREQRRKIEFARSRAEWNALYYEVLHNLVLETTRTGIEVKNLKMRVEALASRLDFSERRVRALEGVVQYRPEALRPARERRAQPQGDEVGEAALDPDLPVTEQGGFEGDAGAAPGDGTARRRRRRRRRRGGAGPSMTGQGAEAEAATAGTGPADAGAGRGADVEDAPETRRDAPEADDAGGSDEL